MGKNVRFYFPSQFGFQIGLAVLAGAVVGRSLGPNAKVLGDCGMLLIQLLKLLVTPLIFFAVVDAFCKTQMRLKSGLQLITVSLTNASIAGLLALLVSEIFDLMGPPDSEVLKAVSDAPSAKETLGALSQGYHFNFKLDSFIPKTVFEPFMSGNTIELVLVSVFIGIVYKKLRASKLASAEDLNGIQTFFSAGLTLTTGMLHTVVRFAPIAVFGVIAKIVGANGFHVFYTLGVFVAVVCLGLFIQVCVYYSLILFSVVRVWPHHFFIEAKDALLTAFGTGSSMATLPVTLKTLDQMKVSEESSRLAAVIGTNLNHDGILLYEAVAALFVAHLYGIKLVLSQKVLLLALSALAAIGIAGVPDAGLITLSLVLSALDLPLGFVPVLLAVDWFLGRLRATTNVTSDLIVARVLDRLSKASSR